MATKKKAVKKYAAIYYLKIWYDDEFKIQEERYYSLSLGGDHVIYTDIEEAKKKVKELNDLSSLRYDQKELERLIEGERHPQPGDETIEFGYKLYLDPTDLKSDLDATTKEDLEDFYVVR